MLPLLSCLICLNCLMFLKSPGVLDFTVKAISRRQYACKNVKQSVRRIKTTLKANLPQEQAALYDKFATAIHRFYGVTSRHGILQEGRRSSQTLKNNGSNVYQLTFQERQNCCIFDFGLFSWQPSKNGTCPGQQFGFMCRELQRWAGSESSYGPFLPRIMTHRIRVFRHPIWIRRSRQRFRIKEPEIELSNTLSP